MQLLLFRHGPAEARNPARWPDDVGRPLTKAGRKVTRQAARGLAAQCSPRSVLASSPLTRARSTAEILAQELEHSVKVQIWDELRPEGPLGAVLRRVARSIRSSRPVILVGHEPLLGELVGLALTGDGVSVTRLRKAGAALITFPDRVAPSGGTLEWLATRDQLVAHGRTV